MKKVLVAYLSRTGKTEKMAEYIAEGIRFTGNTADLRKIFEIKNEMLLDNINMSQDQT
jgi:flavodoxin